MIDLSCSFQSEMAVQDTSLMTVVHKFEFIFIYIYLFSLIYTRSKVYIQIQLHTHTHTLRPSNFSLEIIIDYSL